ncbi:hypothetical protein U8P76_23695 [Rhizobium johnstonii]|nr:hypothetical protein U8P76_23695 [Rhizobium johnstonii]
MRGSIVFVHGTGVRLTDYRQSVKLVDEQLRAAGIECSLVECAWGDPLGIIFEGNSLPDPPDLPDKEAASQELARWSWLFDDPFAELEMLSIRASPSRRSLPEPGKEPLWSARLTEIKTYKPTPELALLLKRAGMEDLWDDAFVKIIASPIVSEAFQRSEEANELADAGVGLARSVLAQLHVDAVDRQRPPPIPAIRKKLLERLTIDWKSSVFGLGRLLANFCKRIGTDVLRRRRRTFNTAIAGPIGDILLYQSRGEEIRQFIRQTVESAPSPVFLVAHSLGGIACVDLLALPNPPKVSALVTVGSQSPFFYEIDALSSIRRPAVLPKGFPAWLNVFDRNDFLSFVGERLFPERVEDFEAYSGMSFPEAHSAYFRNDVVWAKIKDFIKR